MHKPRSQVVMTLKAYYESSTSCYFCAASAESKCESALTTESMRACMYACGVQPTTLCIDSVDPVHTVVLNRGDAVK